MWKSSPWNKVKDSSSAGLQTKQTNKHQWANKDHHLCTASQNNSSYTQVLPFKGAERAVNKKKRKLMLH